MSGVELEDTEQLFSGDPVVISQQLFEKTTHNKIANVLKEIQKEIVKKNNTLKNIFSHNYLELLNCSDLLININEYSKNISTLSEKPAKSLQKIFDLNMNAANLAQDGSIQQSDPSIQSIREFAKPTLKNLSDSIDILISKTNKLFQKHKLFSIAARQTLSLKNLLHQIKAGLKEVSPQQPELYSKYFGEKELLISEMGSEIFEEGVRFILQQNEEEAAPMEQNNEVSESEQQENRIWIYIDKILGMCLLLSALKSRRDMQIFLSSLPCLQEFSYTCQYITLHLNLNNDRGLQREKCIEQCLKESFNIVQEIKLKNLEKNANISKFMNYFSDFYTLVKYFNDRTFYSGFINLFEEINNGLSEYTQLSYFKAFKNIQDVKEYQQSILPADDTLNLQYQSDILGLIQNIYNQQFNQLSIIIRTMLISADDENNQFFNQQLFNLLIIQQHQFTQNFKTIQRSFKIITKTYYKRYQKNNMKDWQELISFIHIKYY